MALGACTGHFHKSLIFAPGYSVQSVARVDDFGRPGATEEALYDSALLYSGSVMESESWTLFQHSWGNPLTEGSQTTRESMYLIGDD